MASELSDSADITSNEIEDGFFKKGKTRNVSEGGLTKKKKIRNDSEGGFIKKRKAEAAVIKDQIDTIQLSSGEYSQARCLIAKTTNSPRNKSCQSNKPYSSERKDVFLSHSGKQKNFVRQLYRDLTNQGVSCFFDQDRESLPLAEHFPSRIFEAAKTCKVAVLLLSKDFLESKWPMLELSAFVEARDTTNPNLKILPLFFRISPDALKNTEENDKNWQQLEISSETPAEWHQALRAIRGINGLPFAEGGDEVKFRDEIVKEIWHILPTPSPRYHVRGMQGEARMCQEVANFFNEVQPIKNGIRIAGLYGIAGHGKTTLGKAFCNFKLVDFEGRVCHLEFSRGDPFERTKLALQYLTHRPHSYMQTLTNLDQAKVELYKRVEGKRVMLVLDNITVESIEEVMYYLEADFGGNSWILLSARSGDVLAKNFQIDELSCMHVPRLKNEEAITLLLQRACPVGSNLGAENREFALKCANRCLFKEISCDNVPRAQTFHPLAVKAFGGYLFSKYGSNLSKWAAEVDGMVDKALDGLDEVFALLGKAFDDMPAKYRTIFMLLTVYMLPNMSVDKVIEWMAINCNAKITFIEKAVQDLREAAFIEEFEPEIRIHDLYIEFAQSKADKMERWLWWKEDLQYDPRGLISEDKDGFELAKLEQCRYETIELEYVGNLFVLQLVDVQDMSTVDLGPMNKLRSITLRDCKVLEALDGMEKLRDLAWLQIIGVNPMFKTPDLSRLRRLQHLEINIAGSHVPDQLGDLTHCSRLREIYVICPHLLEFPRLKGMKNLEKVEFSLCDEVKGPLDCTDCVKLQTIVLNDCCQMTASPLLSGCKKLSKLILSKCDAVTACPDVDAPSALKTLELSISSKAATEPKNLQFFYELENLQLYNMGGLIELPSFKRLSNLTLLELVKCAIREPPDLTVCDRLENVYFFQLKNLVRFPTFSTLKELKKLSLCDCTSVQDPPDIDGCHKLQVFHLLYNNCMKGLPKMDKCAQLEEIQVSWCSPGEVQYQGFNPYSCQADDDLEFCLEHFKDEKFGKISSVSMPEALQQWEWLKGKPMLVKRYFRGLWLYYSLTAPYEDGPSKECKKKTIILGMMNGEVTPSPTTAKDSQDQYWLKKVEGYFAAQKDIASAIVTSASPDIVENISLVIPLSPRYRVPPMQGEERMCQVVADFFKTVNPNEKGIRIAGLYGMPGQGKTALSKAFCQRSLSIFDGKVCYLEFGGGSTSERIKLALQHLTESAMPNQSVAYNLFSTLAKGQRVLLVLDNVTDQNIEEVKYYLGTDFGKDSCILLSSRRLHVLEKYFEIDWKSCMHVPSLQETEVIAILWERKPSRTSGFSAKLENKDFALKCAKKCSFKDERGYVQFHPLALKAFGGQLFRNLSSLFLNWAADGAGDGSNDVFVVLDKVFDCMEYKCRIIFILLTRHMPPSMPTEEALQWLARNCNVEIKYIKKTVVDLCENAFIEEIEPEIRIHDLLKEFGRNKDEDDILAFLNVKEYISHVDPLQLRYPVPPLQGEGRMCQEVAAFFNKVSPNKKGIRIAGLYGMSGQGKTMLAKAFCNRSLRTFDGKVCYLEFCGVNKLERLKHVLHYLTELPMPLIGSVTNDDEARRFFNTLVKGKTVLLVLDNISEESIDEVAYYLQAESGENSCILLSAQSVDLLVKQFNIDSRSCMRVPSLTETEAIAILWERKPSVASGFRAEERQYVLNCARKCSFEENTGSAAFHPLALKVFSRQLFLKQSKHFSIWAASCHPLDRGGRHVSNNVFDMLYKAFALIEDKRRTIFIHLARHKPPNMSTTEVFNWLAKTCNNEIWYIEEAVKDLFESAFIEEMEPEIRIHELMKEFAQMTNKDEYAKPDKIVISPFLEPPSQRYHVPAIQGGTRMCQEVANFFNTVHPNRKKFRIAGLYGMPGQGKTTLCKTFCNLNLRNFDGRVCHLEFCGGNKLDRQKLALQYLTHCSESQLESLTREDEAQKKLYKNVRGHRVLLVLDNITEDSIDEVKYYLGADLGENSCVLLGARSEDVLKKLNVNFKTRMSVPGLQEEEAIAILLERAFPGEPTLEAEDRGFALKCAKRCLFKETCCDNVPRARTFHPLALKAFGGYLFSKYGSDLSKWAAEIDGMEDRAGDGLEYMFIVLDKAFDYMDPICRAIFMLLTLYMLPSICPLNVNEWLEITCKEDPESIEKAVGDLREKSFIEETEPEIRIHNVYMEFALSKARKMKRWLWFEGNLVTSDAKEELKLANVEYYQHLDLSKIGAECDLENLWALQVVDENKEMSNLGISLMKCIRSFTSQTSEYLAVLGGMENLPYLASLQVVKLPDLKTLNLRRLRALEYLEIDIGYSSGLAELGDLTGCVSLREIYVCCQSLSKFPLIHGLQCLEKAKFKGCDEVIGQLDRSGCVKLRSVDFEHCSQMAYIPLIADCSNLSKIVLNRCDPITEYSDENESYALEISELCISSEDASAPRHSECCDGFKNLPLWNIVISSDVPSLRRLSNLTVLKLYKCDISEPPDVTYCSMLEDVYFSRLRCLQRFPNFSSLGKLKKLCLCNCTRVRYPPAIRGCRGLQVFHLLYNDNMEELPQMNGFPILEEIKLSWQLEEENRESWSDEDDELDDSHDDLDDSHDNLEIRPNYQEDEIFRNLNDVFMPEELKKWQWIQDKTVRVKKYSRGLKEYYCMTAPYGGSGAREEASNGNTLEQVTIPTASAICG